MVGFSPASGGSAQCTGLNTAEADRWPRMIAARLPSLAWHQYSAGPSAEGRRYYDWAWVGINPGQPGTAGC
jgi:hypothetical protein